MGTCYSTAFFHMPMLYLCWLTLFGRYSFALFFQMRKQRVRAFSKLVTSSVTEATWLLVTLIRRETGHVCRTTVMHQHKFVISWWPHLEQMALSFPTIWIWHPQYVLEIGFPNKSSEVWFLKAIRRLPQKHSWNPGTGNYLGFLWILIHFVHYKPMKSDI